MEISLYACGVYHNSMGRFFCDYCCMYLSHDSMKSRKQHRFGWRHRENFRKHFEVLIEHRKDEERKKFFLDRGLAPPPMGMPPPALFNLPPPPLPSFSTGQ